MKIKKLYLQKIIREEILNEFTLKKIIVKLKPSDVKKSEWVELKKARKGFGANVEDDIKVIAKILNRKGFSFKGKSRGKYYSYYWLRKKDYDNYRLTGYYELENYFGDDNNFFQLEKIELPQDIW